MSISALTQSIKKFFQFGKTNQQAAAELSREIRRRSTSGKPRARRQRQFWLDSELEKIKGPGQYVLVPPKEMNLTDAQARITARLAHKIGAGKYTTRQLCDLHSVHVTIF